MTAEPKTEYVRKLSSGQDVVISIRDCGSVDMNIELAEGPSSVLTIRVRLEEFLPFVASTARSIASESGLEVAYQWLLGERMQTFKVSPAGRVEAISEYSTDRFKAFIRAL